MNDKELALANVKSLAMQAALLVVNEVSYDIEKYGEPKNLEIADIGNMAMMDLYMGDCILKTSRLDKSSDTPQWRRMFHYFIEECISVIMLEIVNKKKK